MENKAWRPTNWLQIRSEIANMPLVWGPSMPQVSLINQQIEATATKILEEYQKSEIFLKDAQMVCDTCTWKQINKDNE